MYVNTVQAHYKHSEDGSASAYHSSCVSAVSACASGRFVSLTWYVPSPTCLACTSTSTCSRLTHCSVCVCLKRSVLRCVVLCCVVGVQVSKSAGYCCVGRDSPVGCMLLCEVALGDMNELYDADYNANQLPEGKLSTKGVGLTTPDTQHFQTLDNGCVVPCGQPVRVQANTARTPTLQYNEYIGHTNTHTCNLRL